MSYLSIRDLQKISGETIRALDGPTPVKAGSRTIGILAPLRTADPDALAAVLERASKLAAVRDPKEDEAFLAAFPDVDPSDWSVEAVDRLQAAWRAREG
jgi:hypothetical protein